MTDALTAYFQARGVADPSRFGVTAVPTGFRIPIYSLHTGEEAGYEVRLTDDADRKFDRPRRQAPSFNFAPDMRSKILDPKQTLMLVEGSTRHMALATAGVPALSMQGCYGWRTSATAVVPDFDIIPLKGRRIIIGLDGDVASKTDINAALRRLAQFLTQKGAGSVEWIDLPLNLGLDDWLANGGSVWDLPNLFRSMDELPELEPKRLTAAALAEKKGLPDTTDEALAELWVASDPTHAVRVRGTDSWYSYSMGCWTQDRTRDGLDARSSLAALLTQTAERYLEEADTDSEKKVGAEVYRELRSAAKLGAVYSRFKALPAEVVTVADEDFDKDPYLVNCANGTLDLRTGSLSLHQPEDRLRGQCPTRYVPDASAPRWLKFLDEVFPHQPDVVAYLQLILGASLIGKPILHILPVLVGTGRNGKGTLIRALTTALGRDYMAACDNSLLISNKFEGHLTKVMALKGRRIVTASETETGDSFAAAALKRYTGGDELSARGMREDQQVFHPSHNMILQTNHLPRVDVEDEALWARLRLIRFNVSFMDNPELDLDRTLAAEAEGILAWLVAGCRRFLLQQSEGRVPDSIQGATTSWRVEDDQFLTFATEELRLDPKGVIKRADLQAHYKQWCDERGEQMEYRGPKWGQALRRFGAGDGPITQGIRTWKGVRLGSAPSTAPESAPGIIAGQSPIGAVGVEGAENIGIESTTGSQPAATLQPSINLENVLHVNQLHPQPSDQQKQQVQIPCPDGCPDWYVSGSLVLCTICQTPWKEPA